MSGDTYIDGKPGFVGTGSGGGLLLAQIVRLEVEDPRKAALIRLVDQEDLDPLALDETSKNSELTKSATRFSISHGFVMADKSQTVMLMARKSARGSSATQWLTGWSTLSKKGPLFLLNK